MVSNTEEINVSRLFERLYTADKSRHNGETELGLTVVKILTEKLGGNVEQNCRLTYLREIIQIERCNKREKS